MTSYWRRRYRPIGERIGDWLYETDGPIMLVKIGALFFGVIAISAIAVVAAVAYFFG